MRKEQFAVCQKKLQRFSAQTAKILYENVCEMAFLKAAFLSFTQKATRKYVDEIDAWTKCFQAYNDCKLLMFECLSLAMSNV
jgi:hypothetical protein